jgi:hypothetical protein
MLGLKREAVGGSPLELLVFEPFKSREPLM